MVIGGLMGDGELAPIIAPWHWWERWIDPRFTDPRSQVPIVEWTRLPDGSLKLMNGMIQFPDGSVKIPEGVPSSFPSPVQIRVIPKVHNIKWSAKLQKKCKCIPRFRNFKPVL